MAPEDREPQAGLTGASLADLKRQITEAPVAPSGSPPDSWQDAKTKAGWEGLELRARTQFLSLRGVWSWCLIVWITGLLTFQVVLTFLVGINALNFEKYRWFLPLVTAQAFGQIVAMGVVVVRFLYPLGQKPPSS